MQRKKKEIDKERVQRETVGHRAPSHGCGTVRHCTAGSVLGTSAPPPGGEDMKGTNGIGKERLQSYQRSDALEHRLDFLSACSVLPGGHLAV